MRNDQTPTSATIRRRLGLWDAVSIIVGIIIGSAIFQMSPQIFSNAASPELGVAVWALGGFFALVGAFCYAELATTYQSAGGDYTYLSRAYGRLTGYLFAWAELSVIRTGGSIAYMAYVFAIYAQQLTDVSALGNSATLVLASSSILMLTFINYLGFEPGRRTQNTLAAAKVLGLLGIIAVGVAWWLSGQTGSSVVDNPEVIADPPTLTWSTFALAMVFVMYAYGGWNDTVFVAAEVRDPRKNLVRALIYGVLGVTVIYVVVNLAYLGALGFDGARTAKAVASDVLRQPFGESGQQVMAVLVMISALGAINGMLFTGMRLYSTFGIDHRLFHWLRSKDPTTPASTNALLAQAFFSLLLIFVLEFGESWKGSLRDLGYTLAPTPEATEQRIEKLVICTAPVFWVFFFLSGISLIILRFKDAHLPRGFRVPFYPVTPLLFIGMSGFMLYKSTTWALFNEPAEAIIVLGLVLLALPFYRSKPRPQGSESSLP